MSANAAAKHHVGLSRCQIVYGVPMWPTANDAVGFSNTGEYASPLGACVPRGFQFLIKGHCERLQVQLCEL